MGNLGRRGLTTFELLVLLVLLGGAGLYLFGRELFSWGPPPQCVDAGGSCKPGGARACCQGLNCIESSTPGAFQCVPG